jgi:hypothetical protein
MLALPYKKYLYKFNGDFTICDQPVILSTPDFTRPSDEALHGDTGIAVWDAAVFLAKYLESKKEIVENRVVLELGSGLGLVGLSAARCGAKRMYLTDLPYILPTTQYNIENNKLTDVARVVPLDWNRPKDAAIAWDDVDVVIASDTVWVEELVEPFVHTLRFCTRSRRKSIRVLISNQRRSDRVLSLFMGMLEDGFVVHRELTEGNLEIYSIATIQ